jgi:tetratricopeptide (TPR) repeat protein
MACRTTERRSMKSDDLLFEIAFYEGLLKKIPLFVEALICLGDLYTKNGQYEKGLAIDRRLAALRPDDPIVLYNLGCSLALVGQIDAAFATIKRAVDCGYQDFIHMAKDPDLATLHRDERFRKYLHQTVQRFAKKAKGAVG